MRRAAAYCMTRNYYEKAIPSIKSLLVNGGPDVIYLVIEDNEFPFKHRKIRTVNVSGQQIFPPGSANYNSRFTYMCMMRPALFKILDEDRVLSLDADTIINGDLTELWELPLDGYYLAAGKEPAKSREGRLYVNGGVMLLNLAKLRDGKGDELIEALNRQQYAFLEQDCIAEHCQGGILEMPPEYNVHRWAMPTDKKAVITHFAGFSDWMQFVAVQKWAAMEVKDET